MVTTAGTPMTDVPHLNDLIESAESSAQPRSVIHELHAMPAVAEMPVAYVRNTISATFNAAYSTAYSSMGSFLALALEHPGLAQVHGIENPEDLADLFPALGRERRRRVVAVHLPRPLRQRDDRAVPDVLPDLGDVLVQAGRVEQVRH